MKQFIRDNYFSAPLPANDSQRGRPSQRKGITNKHFNLTVENLKESGMMTKGWENAPDGTPLETYLSPLTAYSYYYI